MVRLDLLGQFLISRLSSRLQKRWTYPD